MSKVGKRIIEGLNEAVAWTRGETAMKVTRFVDGKPQSRHMTVEEYLDDQELERRRNKAAARPEMADSAIAKLRIE